MEIEGDDYEDDDAGDNDEDDYDEDDDGDDDGAEMQKAASVASALVLFFPLSVLIFGLYTRKTG